MHPSPPQFPTMPPVQELLQFSCWSCGMELTVPVHLAGITGPCPQCNQMLAAPAAPLQVMPSPPTAASEEDPPKAPSADTDMPMGYRMQRIAPSPEVMIERSGNTVLDSPNWEWAAGLPFLLLGANWQAKFVGVMIGAVIWQLSRHLLKDVVSSSKRLGWFLCIFLVGFVVFIGVCDSFGLPLRHSFGSAASSGLGGSSVETSLAQLRIAAKKKKPGVFTEADFKAAEEAVRYAGRTEPYIITQIYAGALLKRLENRE